jgi:hypothetical protein
MFWKVIAASAGQGLCGLRDHYQKQLGRECGRGAATWWILQPKGDYFHLCYIAAQSVNR